MSPRRSQRSRSRSTGPDGTEFAKQVVKKKQVSKKKPTPLNSDNSNLAKSNSSSNEPDSSDEDILLRDLDVPNTSARAKSYTKNTYTKLSSSTESSSALNKSDDNKNSPPSAKTLVKNVTFAEDNELLPSEDTNDNDSTGVATDNKSAMLSPSPKPKPDIPKENSLHPEETPNLPHFSPIDEITLMEEDELFRDLLANDNKHVRIIDGDGNCLFKAAGDQLGDPFGANTHITLRMMVCDWMEEHKDVIKGFMDENEGSVDDYIAKIRKVGEYASQHEVSSLSATLKRQVNLHLFDSTKNNYQIYPVLHESVLPNEVTGPPICVSRHLDVHYESVYSPSDDSNDIPGRECSWSSQCIMKSDIPEVCNTCRDHSVHRLCAAIATNTSNRLICRACASNEMTEEPIASTSSSSQGSTSINCPPICTISPSTLDVGVQCKTFEEVYSTTLHAAKASGMRPSELAYYCNTYFNEKDSMTVFGCKQVTIKDKPRKIPRRLRFYCTHKGCLWSVGWAWSHTLQLYVVTGHFAQNKVQYHHSLEHNHKTQTVNVDGYVFVSKEDDLTHEEKKFIEYNAFSTCGIPALKVALMKQFQEHKRDYCDQLLSRWRKKHLDNYYGPDRHQMGKMREEGIRVRDAGGVWIEDHDDTWRLNGTTKQTFIQREYAKEFGGYFVEVDGTYGTNTYGFIAGVYVGVCSLGFSTIFGLNTMPAENTHDIARSCDKFLLSNDSDPPSSIVDIEDVPISNKVLENSDKGTIFTDEGAWSDSVAKRVGKDHGLCTLHKTTNIFASRGGLGGDLADEYVEAMYNVIYGDHTEEELDQLLQDCNNRYGHETKPSNYIKSIIAKKEKICHTYMKFIFSHGHTTTARSEGQNAAIKAHGKLIAFLSKATLYEMHQIIDTLHRKQRRRAIKELGELRVRGRRTSEHYYMLREQSIKLCALKVKSCELPQGTDERTGEKGGGAEGIYIVKDMGGHVSFVNLKSRVIHRGQLFHICSCTCSFWMSRKVHCKCIVAACKAAEMDVFHISTVHPLFHIQRHPCWKNALDTVLMEDYNDFKFDNSPSLSATKKKTGGNSNTVGSDDLLPKQEPLQTRFFDEVGHIPPESAQRISKIRELVSSLESLIESGSDHVYQRAYARMLMLLNELEGAIDNNTGEGLEGIRRPRTKSEKKRGRTKNDPTNKSPMVHIKKGGKGNTVRKRKGGPTASTAKKKKKKQNTSNNQQTSTATGVLCCPMCVQLGRMTNRMLRLDHHESQCPNYDEYTQACDQLTKPDGSIDTLTKHEGKA